MKKTVLKNIFFCFTALLFIFVSAQFAYAQATSQQDLKFFLDQAGDFLIKIVGPGVLVIGIAIAGISMAMGEEAGMRRGLFAAIGGAMIMLSRAILDLIQNITHF